MSDKFRKGHHVMRDGPSVLLYELSNSCYALERMTAVALVHSVFFLPKRHPGRTVMPDRSVSL